MTGFLASLEGSDDTVEILANLVLTAGCLLI